MGFPGLIHLFVHSRIRSGPGIDHFFKGREADMQAGLVMFGDIFVANAAGIVGIRVGWVLDDTGMGLFIVGFIRITAVTFLAGKLTMVFILRNFAVHENFFMRSQRLHGSASALPFRFLGRAGFAFLILFYFSCNLDELPCIGMTGKTVILLIGRTRFPAVWEQKDAQA
jgi:hypothetical protein